MSILGWALLFGAVALPTTGLWMTIWAFGADRPLRVAVEHGGPLDVMAMDGMTVSRRTLWIGRVGVLLVVVGLSCVLGSVLYQAL